MSTTISTAEPTQFRADDTVKWTKSLSDYPDSEGLSRSQAPLGNVGLEALLPFRCSQTEFGNEVLTQNYHFHKCCLKEKYVSPANAGTTRICLTRESECPVPLRAHWSFFKALGPRLRGDDKQCVTPYYCTGSGTLSTSSIICFRLFFGRAPTAIWG